jgi:hypothetical protein
MKLILDVQDRQGDEAKKEKGDPRHEFARIPQARNEFREQLYYIASEMERPETSRLG